MSVLGITRELLHQKSSNRWKMADQQRGRGRARGRVRDKEQIQSFRVGGDQQRDGEGGSQQRDNGGGGPASQQMQPLPFGRGTYRTGNIPGGEQQISSRVGGNGDTENIVIRRGIIGGRRQQAIRTRPDSLPTKQGSHGQVIHLSANYFKLIQRTNWCLYQYRVDFAPEDDRTNVKKKLFYRATRNQIAGYIFDGTVLYTSNHLTPDQTEYYVTDENTNEPVRITIRLVGDVAVGDYQNLQLFNVIMRKCLGFLKLQLVGRNFFDALAKVSIPEHRIELWPGYVTSIRQHENAILMCCEINHKIMRQDTVLQLLAECTRENGANYREAFQSRIINAVVLTDYNNRTYRIDDVDFNSTPASTFSKRDGTTISYVQYFKDKYNLRITRMNQPMLVSRAKAREIRAGMAETVYLVPELCRMTGLTDAQRANLNLMRALARETNIIPGQRIEELNRFRQRLRQEPNVVAELKKWDLEFANNLIEFTGRVLPPETIMGGQGMSYSAGKDVDWTKELYSKPMLYLAPLNTWVVVYPSCCKTSAQSFVQMLQRTAKGMNWALPFPRLQEIRDDRPVTYLEGLDAAINSHSPQLIMCIVTNKKADRYAAIKKKCCVDRAVPTQVILAKNLDSRGVMSIATKVAIQMNCKLGGAPWSIPLPYQTMMVVGYDVCHDTNHKERSYGALVASLGYDCIRYFSTVTAHTNGEELSNDFALGIIKACRRWLELHGTLPGKIMIYRDGVGDGQLNYVFEHEVQKIKSKLVELYGSEDKVKMAFIVVSKRINTRIFTRSENPLPSTVVDDVITLPERYDFFIVSQCVRQGTVSPTSYNVLFDNIKESADKLQRVTYKLTHMYFNWSGTVRVPAPCQYAHKLAFLVAQSLHRNPHAELENVLYFL